MDSNNYWKIVGYLQAYADLKTCIDRNVFYTYMFESIDNTGNIEESLKKHFADVEFVMSPSEILQDMDNNKIANKHKKCLDNCRLQLKKIPDWNEDLSKAFTFWIKGLFNVQDDNSKIDNAYNCFYDLLSEAFEYQKIDVLMFDKEDYEFIRKFFGFVICDIYIFVTCEKIYILSFGLND